VSALHVIRTVAEMQAASDDMRRAGRRIGLVPTMGYLHEGHQSLIRRIRRDADRVVVSVFVNPTQFGPSEDLASYPRDLSRDIALIAESGGDIVFAPEAEDVYPDGFSTSVSVKGLSGVLDGASRPGHFDGVATVVAKLFACVRPHSAVFGQKDAQQVAVIRRMTADLNMGVEILVCPTVREADGLAKSSRNIYLTPDERSESGVLFQALQAAENHLRAGEADAGDLEAIMVEKIRCHPVAELDYAVVRDAETLGEVKEVRHPALAAVAARFGKSRLIDNLVLFPADRADS